MKKLLRYFIPSLGAHLAEHLSDDRLASLVCGELCLPTDGLCGNICRMLAVQHS